MLLSAPEVVQLRRKALGDVWNIRNITDLTDKITPYTTDDQAEYADYFSQHLHTDWAPDRICYGQDRFLDEGTLSISRFITTKHGRDLFVGPVWMELSKKLRCSPDIDKESTAYRLWHPNILTGSLEIFGFDRDKNPVIVYVHEPITSLHKEEEIAKRGKMSHISFPREEFLDLLNQANGTTICKVEPRPQQGMVLTPFEKEYYPLCYRGENNKFRNNATYSRSQGVQAALQLFESDADLYVSLYYALNHIWNHDLPCYFFIERENTAATPNYICNALKDRKQESYARFVTLHGANSNSWCGDYISAPIAFETPYYQAILKKSANLKRTNTYTVKESGTQQW